MTRAVVITFAAALALLQSSATAAMSQDEIYTFPYESNMQVYDARDPLNMYWSNQDGSCNVCVVTLTQYVFDDDDASSDEFDLADDDVIADYSSSIVAAGDFLYVTASYYGDGTAAKVYKLEIGDISAEDDDALDLTYVYPQCIVADASGEILVVGYGDDTSMLEQVLVTGWEIGEEADMNTDNFIVAVGDGVNGYFSTDGALVEIYKVDLETLDDDSAVYEGLEDYTDDGTAAPAPRRRVFDYDDESYAIQMSYIDGMLFAAFGSTPPVVTKIDTTTMEELDEETRWFSDEDASVYAFTTDGSFGYTSTYDAAPLVTKIDLATMEKVKSMTITYGDDYFAVMVADPNSINFYGVVDTPYNDDNDDGTTPDVWGLIKMWTDECGVYCNNHATDAADVNGDDDDICDCPCTAAYNGTRCDECATHYDGYPNCTAMACNATEDCNGNAASVTGDRVQSCVCNCNTGFAGDMCESCATGYELWPVCSAVPESSSSSSSEVPPPPPKKQDSSSSASAPLVASAWALIGLAAALIAA